MLVASSGTWPVGFDPARLRDGLFGLRPGSPRAVGQGFGTLRSEPLWRRSIIAGARCSPPPEFSAIVVVADRGLVLQRVADVVVGDDPRDLRIDLNGGVDALTALGHFVRWS